MRYVKAIRRQLVFPETKQESEPRSKYVPSSTYILLEVLKVVRSVTLLSQCTWTKQAELLELKKASKGGDSDSNDGDEGKRAMGVYTTKLCSSSISLCAMQCSVLEPSPGRTQRRKKYRRRNTSGCDYCPGVQVPENGTEEGGGVVAPVHHRAPRRRGRIAWTP